MALVVTALPEAPAVPAPESVYFPVMSLTVTVPAYTAPAVNETESPESSFCEKFAFVLRSVVLFALLSAKFMVLFAMDISPAV